MKVNYHTFKGICYVLVLTLMSVATANAQRVSGVVMDAETNEFLPGATIVVKDASRGTVSDGEGKFTIDARSGEALIVSFVGYAPQTVVLDGQASIVIKLSASNMLQEVTVAALGFRKDKAKVGYAVQDVKGDDLLKAREPNAINSLAGKVSGLIVGASPELLGAPSLNLRGSNPIFVVDGVPVNSDTWNISADDIETFTVLKGPSAAALYGARSQDGVIMITTKKGSHDKRGYSIEFNTSQMFEQGFNALPEVQSEYGPGDHGRYAFKDGRGGGVNDGDYDIWGPKFEGQAIPQYDSPVNPDGTRQATPWTARGTDNLERFLRPGFLSNNNISISTSSDKVDMRYSTSYNYQQGMMPNTQLNVANFNVYSGIKFSDRVKLEANVNYNRQFTDNIPEVTYGPNSMIYNIIIWGASDWNIDDMRNYWQPGKEGVQQIYEEYQRYNNPWFMAKEWFRGHQKTDIYGQTALSWNVAPGLDFKVRTAITTYDLFRNEKFPYSATVYGREESKGDYREDKRSLFENNTDAYLNYDTKLGDLFSLTTLIGGNLRTFNFESNYTTTNYLNVPGLYAFNNSANPLIASNFRSKMQTQSGYYSVDLGLKTWLFLSHTGRVDHLSTLPKKHNTFYYPSLGASFILSELVDLGPVSFLKLRGSYANVKSALTQRTINSTPGLDYPLDYGAQYQSSYDGPSYGNGSAYSTPLVNNNQPGAYYTNTISNPELSPLSRTNYETGIEAHFLRNRLNLDVTYFQYIDGPQIFAKPISEASGYTSQLVNAVKTKNAGWEVSLSGSPIKHAKGFSWDVLVNWSTYRQTLEELPEGITRLYGFYQKGDRLDTYYDRAFVRTKDGQIVNDASGRPIYNPISQKLGYSNPDWVWSVVNKVSWKNVSLGFQFDGRVGGHMKDFLQQQTFRGGRNIATTEGLMGEVRNADWLVQKEYSRALAAGENPKPLSPSEDGNWLGEGVYVSNGVTIEYDKVTGEITNYDQLEFASNTTKTWLQDYISRYYNSGEGNLISKTFAKLREVTLTYQLPQKWFKNGRFAQGASVSLVGRNLIYFSKHKDIDLDNYITTSSPDLQSPTAKRYGVNINITF
ncbi:MAG: SusC/RagA family TonB-linked outer membrane protein [Phycisphaerae bacterium]|nr:SusC/RagA family TonB-linked outer membrane protein [Saprospiraceae bacterium]